ncbi:unnamed protein product, partial [Tetraodon nigroviridis]
VEIVVKTDAEAGASGYSVTGGGQQGIFVKDVLKDSPAAKHLSLKEGDQLLSAKVYFENVKYEDALKILQCAEPYKVSFELKRTIPGAEVSMRPCVPSVEVKGPKPKLTKMSVKGSKPFKAKKKRGGRFGLKRLKEKRREELVIEGIPPRLESGGVDVEFAFPTFKQRRRIKVEAEGAVPGGKAKRKIRMPKLKLPRVRLSRHSDEIDGAIKVQAKAMPQNDVLPPQKGIETDENLAKMKAEGDLPGKALSSQIHVGDISLPKVKEKTDINVSLSGDQKKGEIMAQLPTVNMPVTDVDLNTRHSDEVESPNISIPKVDFSLHESESISLDRKNKNKFSQPTVDVSLPKAKGIGDVDMTSYVGGDGRFTMPDFDISIPNMTSTVPKGLTPKDIDVEGDISLPKVKSPDVDVSIEGPEMKGGKLSLPSVDTDLDVEGPQLKGHKFKMPKFDVSLPKVNLPEGNVSMPALDISLPKGNLKGDVDVDGHMGKGARMHVPSVDLAMPKMKAKGVDLDIEGPELKVDISIPRGEFEADLDVEGPDLKGSKFKLPKFDVSLPKVNLPEGHINVQGPEIKGKKIEMPDIDISVPKGKCGTLNMPSLDVSLPQVKASDVEINLKGPDITGEKVNMPAVDISLPKGKMEGEINVEPPDVKGGKFKMPKFDVSLPKISLPKVDANVEGPSVKGDIKMPSVDVSLPKGKTDVEFEIDGKSGKEGKFHLPSFDVSLPKIKSKGFGVDIPNIEGDVSLPKVKSPDVDVSIEGPEMKGGKLSLPSVDTDLDVEGPQLKGHKFKMPKFDVSLPKVNLPEGNVSMPALDISLPKGNLKGDVDVDGHMVKASDVEINLEGPDITGEKVNIPAVDISLPKGKMEGEINVEPPDVKGGKFKMPKFDVSLPKISLPKVDANVEGPS